MSIKQNKQKSKEGNGNVKELNQIKKYFIWGGGITLLILIFFPVIVNFIMNFDFSFRVSGDEGEWIPFYASFYGALLGGGISGALTLGGVYLTIQHERQNRILETYPQKRKHAGDVLIYMEEVKKFVSKVYDKENEETLNKYDGKFSEQLGKFTFNNNSILNSAAMVNGTYFYNTRKVIAHLKAIEDFQRTPAIHPYHRLDMDMNQVEYAKIVLETINELEEQAREIDRKIDELNY